MDILERSGILAGKDLLVWRELTPSGAAGKQFELSTLRQFLSNA